MNKVILSFDYEIYFDGSNDYDQLIRKTNEILRIAESRNIKLVFFVDVLYMVKLEEFGLTGIAEQLKTQILDIKSKGHELQFHFHPHWLNAIYEIENERWLIDSTEFSYSDLIDKYGLERANAYFNEAYNSFKNYFQTESFSYRAGGLSINKYQNELIQLLVDHSFKIDSSVLPNLLLKGKSLTIDHRQTPLKDKWKIDAQSGFFVESSEQSAGLTEVPIMAVDKSKISLFKRIFVSLNYRLSRILSGNKSTEALTNRMIDLHFETTQYPISITFDKSSKSDTLLMKHFTREFFSTGFGIMCILSHPKSFRESSFEVFDEFVAWCKRHPSKYQIVSFKDIV